MASNDRPQQHPALDIETVKAVVVQLDVRGEDGSGSDSHGDGGDGGDGGFRAT